MASISRKGLSVELKACHSCVKVVKHQGLDGDRPMIGDKVTVHYTGRLLNGKKFDCSRDRKEPICFNVGKGRWCGRMSLITIIITPYSSSHFYNIFYHSFFFCWLHPLIGQVLKAWDIGVLSMQRGEVSTLLCKPEYAYGTAGNPGKIPPSSSVVFEVGVATSGLSFVCALILHHTEGPWSFSNTYSVCLVYFNRSQANRAIQLPLSPVCLELSGDTV